MDLVPERHKVFLHVPPPSLEVTFKVHRADGGPSECDIDYITASGLPIIMRIVHLTIYLYICILLYYVVCGCELELNKIGLNITLPAEIFSKCSKVH